MGETGTGKTTVCQLLALLRSQHLHILNCNQHTETSDFLGGFRPARGREAAAAAFLAACRRVAGSGLFAAVGAAAPDVQVGRRGVLRILGTLGALGGGCGCGSGCGRGARLKVQVGAVRERCRLVPQVPGDAEGVAAPDVGPLAKALRGAAAAALAAADAAGAHAAADVADMVRAGPTAACCMPGCCARSTSAGPAALPQASAQLLPTPPPASAAGGPAARRRGRGGGGGRGCARSLCLARRPAGHCHAVWRHAAGGRDQPGRGGGWWGVGVWCGCGVLWCVVCGVVWGACVGGWCVVWGRCGGGVCGRGGVIAALLLPEGVRRAWLAWPSSAPTAPLAAPRQAQQLTCPRACPRPCPPLPQDAVLERLNSVLEPSRTLTLAERGGEGAEVVRAADGFRCGRRSGPARAPG